MPALSIDAELPDDLPKPEGANWFTVSRLGTDVEILVGYLDIKRTAQELERAGAVEGEDVEISLPVDVTHRFVMGGNALLNLKDKVDEIVKAMRQSGHLPDADRETDLDIIE